MAKNLAAQRGRKAAHRKQVLADRRKSEVGRSPLDDQIARAAFSPFQACLMPDLNNDTAGMGAVIVARGYGAAMTTVFFLVDLFALGVKDAFMRSCSSDELDEAIAAMAATSPMVEAEPAMVRKFLHDLVAWARDKGFDPPRDYAGLERIFGDVDIAASDATFSFGEDGRPVLISGPFDAPAQLRQGAEMIAQHEERTGLPPPGEDNA